MSRLDDGTLMAYVDGELDPDSIRRVEAALKEDVRVQARARILRDSAALVHAALNEAVHEPVPERLTRTVRDAGKGRPEWRRRIAMPVAASLAALVIGVGAGYLGGAQWSSDGVEAAESERWLDDIASFHLLYAREERHLVEVGADRSDELQAWLGKHLHRDLRIPDLSAPGFTFEGGRLLMSGGKPLAQLLYLPPEGRPLGLCITVSAEPDRRPHIERRQGLNLVYWTQNGYAYALVGWLDEPRLRALAGHVAAQLANT